MMNVMNEDAELASEMVSLLGRELKAARRHIVELKDQLVDAEKARAQEEKKFRTHVEELKAKMVQQEEEKTAAETAALERAQTAENALKPHLETAEDNLKRIRELQDELACYKEKYKAASSEQRALRSTCRSLRRGSIPNLKEMDMTDSE